MEYFKKYFTEIESWDKEEVLVHCPFHNDLNPSASINTDKNLFHCWVCNVGYNEEQFVARMNNISNSEAIKLLNTYNYSDNWDIYNANLWSDSEFLKSVQDVLHIGVDLINDMNLGMIKDKMHTNVKLLAIPIFYNNMLVDIRKYNLLKENGVPKMQSEENAKSGWIIPYDKFLLSDEVCYFFEGEKDMLIAREYGLNAYTMTSGASATPNEYTLGAFKDKDIILCYDNDVAGKEGMLGMFKAIREVTKSVKYINIGDAVDENKEDFYDFIIKYEKDIIDFYSLEVNNFDAEDLDKDNLVTVKDAMVGNLLKKELESLVMITSEYVDTYAIPTIVEFEKVIDDTKGSMFKGETKIWYLEDNNLVEMLELIEVSAEKNMIIGKIKRFAGIDAGELGVSVKTRAYKTVYKSVISDKDTDENAINLDLYSFNKLNVGGQYHIKYKIYPHPTKHQKVVSISMKNTLINDNKNYVINKNLLSLLKTEGSIEERLDYLFQSAKHHIAKHLNYDLWLMSDLVYNSILDFNYGDVLRGALDIFILGDTTTGKSELNKGLVNLYNFGHFLSLKTSTTVGLIGGSKKVDGTYCNTIGSIPRQHKALVVLEEFSGARPDFIKTMTDIRSSNELRLSRVSGELRVPCKLRMITISNPINDENGTPRFLNTFPNGVMPLMELIKSAEDVARYDGFLLVPRVEKRFNPFKYDLVGEPVKKEAYEHKSKWVITRKPENVLFDKDVEGYIWDKAEELNDLFECNFPLFGTTTSKKLARFCVAMASLILNVDSSFENIIVTKDIVDYVCEFFKKVYDNNVFKLKEYANEYKQYSIVTEDDVKALNKLYAKNATLLNFLNIQNRTTRANLSSISGLETAKFHPVFNTLVSDKFIRLNMDNVYPTDKFRQAFSKINKDFVVDTVDMLDNSGVVFVNDLGGLRNESEN